MSERKKKVIFIGGTSYSGSTFFDMILANDPKGFSCGEVNALFNPYRPYHIKPLCGCGSKDCNLWKKILNGGEKNLYKTIFDYFPELEFIVDSSKDPYWIRSHAKNLFKQKIETKNLLIWKTPLEFSYSYKKRGKIHWRKEWINYHRLYITALKNWRTVKYYELTCNPNSLIKVCNYIGIPYFHGKHRYWNKEHHSLFGNRSAKIHLLSKITVKSKLLDGHFQSNSEIDDHFIKKTHRTIYYKRVDNCNLKNNINEQFKNDKKLRRIYELLIQRDVSNNFINENSDYELSLSKLNFNIRRARRLLYQKFTRSRYQLMN